MQTVPELRHRKRPDRHAQPLAVTVSPANQTVQPHTQFRVQPSVSVHLAPLSLYVENQRRDAVRLIAVAPVFQRLRQPPKQPQKRRRVPASILEVRPPVAGCRPTPPQPPSGSTPTDASSLAELPSMSTSQRMKPSSLGARPRLFLVSSSRTREVTPRRACAPSTPRPLYGTSACLGSARLWASGWSRNGGISCRVGRRAFPTFQALLMRWIERIIHNQRV